MSFHVSCPAGGDICQCHQRTWLNGGNGQVFVRQPARTTSRFVLLVIGIGFRRIMIRRTSALLCTFCTFSPSVFVRVRLEALWRGERGLSMVASMVVAPVLRVLSRPVADTFISRRYISTPRVILLADLQVEVGEQGVGQRQTSGCMSSHDIGQGTAGLRSETYRPVKPAITWTG